MCNFTFGSYLYFDVNDLEPVFRTNEIIQLLHDSFLNGQSSRLSDDS